jgi:hypothetical protein
MVFEIAHEIESAVKEREFLLATHFPKFDRFTEELDNFAANIDGRKYEVYVNTADYPGEDSVIHKVYVRICFGTDIYYDVGVHVDWFRIVSKVLKYYGFDPFPAEMTSGLYKAIREDAQVLAGIKLEEYRGSDINPSVFDMLSSYIDGGGHVDAWPDVRKYLSEKDYDLYTSIFDELLPVFSRMLVDEDDNYYE